MTYNLRHPVSPRHSLSLTPSLPRSRTHTHTLSLSLSASVSFSHTHNHTQSHRRDALADVAFSQTLRTFEQNLYATTGSTLEESLGERRCVSIRMFACVCVCVRESANVFRRLSVCVGVSGCVLCKKPCITTLVCSLSFFYLAHVYMQIVAHKSAHAYTCTCTYMYM